MPDCPQSVTFLVPENSPTATYTITFQGVTVEDCTSKWCYNVSVTGAPGLSHWVLGVFESCQELLSDKLLLVTRDGVELEEGTGYVLGTSDGVFGIKFEVGVEGGESAVYCITLQGVYEPTAVDVAVKGGPTPAQKEEDALCGPSCVAIPCEVTPCQAIVDLLESVALQEAGLAHIINAEGEKIQTAIAIEGITIEDLVTIDQSVSDTLVKVIKMEMLLQFKLEEISRIECPACPPCPTTPI
jgi:hypothetical protein